MFLEKQPLFILRKGSNMLLGYVNRIRNSLSWQKFATDWPLKSYSVSFLSIIYTMQLGLYTTGINTNRLG
jgi:hypothetical protein